MYHREEVIVATTLHDDVRCILTLADRERSRIFLFDPFDPLAPICDAELLVIRWDDDDGVYD